MLPLVRAPIAGFAGPVHGAPKRVDARVGLVSTTTREGVNAALVLKAV